jgi:hypothetical protein
MNGRNMLPTFNAILFVDAHLKGSCFWSWDVHIHRIPANGGQIPNSKT